jgi:hypothetical protein
VTEGERLAIKREFWATFGLYGRPIQLPAGDYDVLPGPHPGVHTLSGGPPTGERYRVQVTSAELDAIRKDSVGA